ncbi:protein FAR1-RELATED SEQUENCE 5-like [Lolium perenne]|uniref:protein FAR1-RELATED SEQUENCE 5-like n=1 Tax=Lolium perenne TaxID=4522 RepID=UPI003A9990BD
MDWFNLHGIDLNHPPGYDDFIEPDGTEAPIQGTSVDGTGANSGFMSVDDTTDGAPTGQTLSSEESGSDGEVQSTPEGFAPRKPYLGMKFDTWEAAKVHYNRYAEHVGFSMKMSSSRNSVLDKQKDKYLFVCNKSGTNSEKEETEAVKLRNRAITIRTNCQAKMRVKRKGSIWEVTQFIEEHTHETIKKLGLKKYLRSHKKIPKEEKKFIDLLDSVNLSAGRIMDIMSELYGTGKSVPYDTKTISNYMASIDEKQNVKDIPELLSYFEELKKEDPNFFYKYKLDSEDRIENIFWVDGPTREVYKNYNDCISFDTTYMTNAYKMPCAPIIGINRYGQTIQLGCGFLRNEKISNFVWLFEQFLDAMDGLHPLNIITDQDAAITTAIQEMFPNSCHRNCRWHIMQNAQGSPLGPFMAKHEELRREFNEIVDYSLTPVEFENRWGEMIERHGVSDNTDLAYIYEIRAKFVPAYFMDRFFPFLQTTARSEGFNAVLKRYVDPNASLLRFFKQYMKLQERIDITEDSHELWQINPSLFEVSPIRNAVFGYGARNYRITANLEQDEYSCECCKFTRDGLICCHIIKVMSAVGKVEVMPERYILPRWSIPPPDIRIPQTEPQQMPAGKLSRKEMRLLRYGNLTKDFAKLAVNACASEKTDEVARKHMRATEAEFAAMKKQAADALKRKKKQKETVPPCAEHAETTENPSSSTVGAEHNMHVNKKARDPPLTVTKGRPEEKRKKSGLHLKPAKPTKCTICGSSLHNPKDCPSKIAMKEKTPIIQLFQ